MNYFDIVAPNGKVLNNSRLCYLPTYSTYVQIVVPQTSQSEFESRWSLQFFSRKFVLEKNENKKKEAHF